MQSRDCRVSVHDGGQSVTWSGGWSTLPMDGRGSWQYGAVFTSLTAAILPLVNAATACFKVSLFMTAAASQSRPTGGKPHFLLCRRWGACLSAPFRPRIPPLNARPLEPFSGPRTWFPDDSRGVSHSPVYLCHRTSDSDPRLAANSPPTPPRNRRAAVKTQESGVPRRRPTFSRRLGRRSSCRFE